MLTSCEWRRREWAIAKVVIESGGGPGRGTNRESHVSYLQYQMKSKGAEGGNEKFPKLCFV